MMIVTKEKLNSYRTDTFRTAPHRKISTLAQALDFVNERGFIYFWPNKDTVLPSLWTAVAGERPVADEHDDPGHVTWGWKDSMLGKRQWFYSRVLRKRNTFISLELAPYFYALSENFGSPDEDYLYQYQQGRMTMEARQIYEALLEKGPLDTLQLRKAAHLTSRTSDSRFNKAIIDLQVDFKILPVGVADAGAWHYAHIYDIVSRHFPELPEQARFIEPGKAQVTLIQHFLRALGAVSLRDITRLFGWTPAEIQEALKILVNQGIACSDISMEGQGDTWVGYLPWLDSI